MDRPAHRHRLAHASLALGVVQREFLAEVGGGHPTPHVDADDVGDDALAQPHCEADGRARAPVGVGHDTHRFGERGVVDELLNLLHTPLLDERLVVDHHACRGVGTRQLDWHYRW